ncbi:MAG: beta-ketoacyl-[acyl-carrier-protein] synthase II [Alphaproteobacteria bacterium]|nr:beta-ketoacyl-[acyl-carrier-protein] synthase II [Alphaproteobacteria bacterium]
MNCVLSNLGFVCALGTNTDDISRNARNGDQTGMQPKDVIVNGDVVPFGMVKIATKHDMRFYDLLLAAFEQIRPATDNIKSVYSPARIGIVLGASNTAVHEAQQHINNKLSTGVMPDNFSVLMLELGTPAELLRGITGIKGPAFTISTACSSSIKALDCARDLIKKDICDAVICGGVDARCDFALNGFNALEALSHKITNSMSKNRDGINLGECAALFIMQRGENGIFVKGFGETSDAYHPTAPDPSGTGAIESMQKAIMDAKLLASDIDYISMHGTGTLANDAMESRAIYDIFADKTICASSKSLTGHCLGAAGACSVALSWLMLTNNFIIPHVYDGHFADDCAPIKLATTKDNLTVQNVLCNAFAFGGSNSTIIIGK